MSKEERNQSKNVHAPLYQCAGKVNQNQKFIKMSPQKSSLGVFYNLSNFLSLKTLKKVQKKIEREEYQFFAVPPY